MWRFSVHFKSFRMKCILFATSLKRENPTRKHRFPEARFSTFSLLSKSNHLKWNTFCSYTSEKRKTAWKYRSHETRLSAFSLHFKSFRIKNIKSFCLYRTENAKNCSTTLCFSVVVKLHCYRYCLILLFWSRNKQKVYLKTTEKLVATFCKPLIQSCKRFLSWVCLLLRDFSGANKPLYFVLYSRFKNTLY